MRRSGGQDSLAAFRIDRETGKLKAAGTVGTGGKNPRHFGIDPSGRFLIAANQNSDSVTVFRMDGETGATAVGKPVATPRPVCVVFVEVK